MPAAAPALLISGPFRRYAAMTVNRARRALTPFSLRRYDRLHLGAGWRHLPGWANLDLYGRRNLIWDLTRPLPLGRGTVRFIYSEHFVEHIPREACRRLLENARAALADEGVLRISTPDLAFWARAYLEGRVFQHEHSRWNPGTPCEMLNDQMRLWGHQLIYDEPELSTLLRGCGFSRVERMAHGESRFPPLQAIESRPSCGDLILEARP